MPGYVIRIPKRKFMISRSKVYNDKPLVLLNIFIIEYREGLWTVSWMS